MIISILSYIYFLLIPAAHSFHENFIEFEVSEDVAIGTLIGKLPLESQFQYRCIRCPKEVDIDLTSGEIKVAHMLDRESGNGSLLIVLTSNQPSILHSAIRLLDVNDNAPYFPLSFQNVSIVESATVGTRIPLVAALDLDEGVNAQISSYSILPTNKTIPFDVQDVSGVLYLVVNSSLDREVIDQFVFNITAEDAGYPARSGQCVVHVQVLDVNDNTPVIQDKNLNISWNGVALTPILSLNATDADLGLNGQIVYRVLGDEASYFTFKQNVLYSKTDSPACCSRPTCHQCILSIFVSDQGGPPLSTVVSVTVDIETTNLHEPVIALKLFPSTVDFAVIDNSSPVGKTIAVFTISDEDGPLADDSLQITAGNEERAFILSSQRQFSVLKLAVNGTSLLQSFYELEFTCNDQQKQSRTAKRSLKIYAHSQDHMTLRAPAPQSVRIPRSSDNGTFVAVVKMNNTGDYKFEIENENTPFSIDELSGIITTNGSISLATNRLSLYIRIFPPPPAVLPISTEVVVTFDEVIKEKLAWTTQADVNRTGPHNMEIRINPLVPLGRQLYRFDGGLFTTTCPDLTIDTEGILSLKSRVQANQIQCEVKNMNNITETSKNDIKVFIWNNQNEQNIRLNRSYTFWIDEFTSLAIVIGRISTSNLLIFSSTEQTSIGIFPDGVLYVKRPIDRTIEDVIILPVQAMHRVLNSTFTSTVYVYVNDINNNSPTCKSQQFHIKEKAPLHTVIGRLSCSDDDFGMNSMLKYRIIDDKKLVEVRPATGIIRSLASFDAEEQHNFTISVEVSDLGKNPKKINMNVTISIEDVNDNKPIFEHTYYKSDMFLDSIEKTEKVGQVKCIDEDQSEKNSKIEYGIENFQNIFEINHKTGEIYRTERLVEHSLYNISVFCQNPVGGLNKNLMRTNSFILLSTKYNKTEAPQIISKDSVISILPTSAVGSIIGQIYVKSSVSATFFINDSRVTVDTWGNIILSKIAQDLPEQFFVETTVTSSEGISSVYNQQFQVIKGITNSFTIKGDRYPIIVTSLAEDVSLVITDPPSARFQIKDAKLLMLSGDGKPTKYTIVLKEKSKLRILNVNYVGNSVHKKPMCHSKVTILHERPHRVTIHCDTMDVVMSTPDENKNVKMIGKNEIEIVGMDGLIETVKVTVYDSSLTYSTTVNLTILSDIVDSSISFPSNKYSLLLSSSHKKGDSFGRITADSQQPLQYFIVGPSEIVANRLTGELVLLGNLSRDVHLTMIALSQNGISTVEVFIELIEDSLTIPPTILILTESIRSEYPIGLIDIGRNDVKYLLENSSKFKINGNQIIPLKDTSCENNIHELSLEAKKGRLSADLKVFIVYVPPTEPSTVTELFVRENAPLGTVFGRLPGPDWKLSNSVDFLTVDENLYFRTAKVFDFEKKSMFAFNITRGGTIREMSLFIDDENDNVPTILNGNTTISIVETAELGREIWKFRWNDTDLNNAFEWSIIEGNEYDLFMLDQNGELSIKRSLDREISSQHRLKIQLSDGVLPYKVYSVICSFVIDVIDINDNPPQLTSTQQLYVSENTAKGTVIGVLTATDADLKENSQFAFRVLPDSLPNAELLVDPVFGHIIVNGLIDYEEQQNISFILEIYDFGVPSLSSYWPILVFIGEENDNKPEFKESSTIISVLETTLPPTVIYTFNVNDNDGLDNALCSYSILGETGPFSIGARSGELHVRSSLDYETRRSYNLTIIAQNIVGGQTVIRQVIINLLDANDEAPQFILGSPVHYEIYENMAGPYPLTIALSIAEDDDEGLNGKISYSMLAGDNSKFTVNSMTGEIQSLEALDKEEMNEYWLKVKAIDSGKERLSSHTDIKITVLDVNDNIPMFKLPEYRTRIKENCDIGSKVIQVEATDKDIEENGKIRFSIVGGPVPFTINHDTGLITVSDEIDREREAHFNFQVKAEDQGRFIRHSSEVPIFIEIEDVNDNVPIIRNSQLDVMIPNNLNKDDVLYVVDVIDADGGPLHFNLTGMEAKMFYINNEGEIRLRGDSTADLISTTVTIFVYDDGQHSTSNSFTFYFNNAHNFPKFSESPSHLNITEGEVGELFSFHANSVSGPLQYSILAGNNGAFEIDSTTGMLQLIKELDYEEKSELSLWITATSRTNPPFSSFKNIRIYVEDVNDNPPAFEKILYKGDIMENAESKAIVQVKAFDVDTNSSIEYKILEGNAGDSFRITEDGKIHSTKALDREEKREYMLIVEASDGPHKRKTAVEITVLDEDDNGPKFPRLFHVNVPEDLPIGSTIIRVEATDADGYFNHSYSMDNDYADTFALNSSTGEITLKHLLDRENVSSYRIPIRVLDGYNSISTNLQITVEDVNDNTPMFRKSPYIFMAEETGVLGFVTASDEDIGSNGKVYYELLVDSSFVSINSTTGEVMLARRPPWQFTDLTVVASDRGVPRRNSTVSMIIINKWMIHNEDEAFVIYPNNSKNIGKLMEMADLVLSENGRFSVENETIVPVNDLAHENTTDNLVLFYSDCSCKIIPVQLGPEEMSIRFTKSSYDIILLQPPRIPSLVGVLEIQPSNENVEFSATSQSYPFQVTRNGDIVVVGDLGKSSGKYNFSVAAKDKNGVLLDRSHVLISIDPNAVPTILTRRKTFAVMENKLCDAIFVSSSFYNLTYITDNDRISIDSTNGCINMHGARPPTLTVAAIAGNSSQSAELYLVHMNNWMDSPDMEKTSQEEKEVNLVMSKQPKEGNAVLETEDYISIRDNSYLFSTGTRLLTKENVIINNQSLNITLRPRFTRTIKRQLISFVGSDEAIDISLPDELSVAIPEDTPNGTTIIQQKLYIPSNYNIYLKGKHNKEFCPKLDGSIILCGRLALQSSPYILTLEISNSLSKVMSHSTVTVTVTRPIIRPPVYLTGYVIDAATAGNILRIPTTSPSPKYFKILDPTLKKMFSVSSHGILSHTQPILYEESSVINVGVEVQTEGEIETTPMDITVLVEKENPSYYSDYSISVSVLDKFSPAKDLNIFAGSKTTHNIRCSPKVTVNYEVNAACSIAINSTSGIIVVLTRQTSTEQVKYTVTLKEVKTSGGGLVKLDLFASELGIARLLFDMEEKNSDLKIVAVSVVSHSISRHSVYYSVRDPSNNPVSLQDAIAVMQNFFNKSAQNHYILSRISDFYCEKCFECLKKSRTLRWRNRTWITGAEDLTLSKCDHIEANNVAVKSVQRMMHSDVTVTNTTCRSDSCLGGICKENENGQYCECGAFIGSSCLEEMTTLSLSEGHIELLPVDSILDHRQTLPVQQECNSTQAIVMDVRIQEQTGILMTFDHGLIKAIVEVVNGSPVFRLWDGHRNLAVLELQTKLDVQQWHRISLQLNDDLKELTFRVNEVGRVARSMKPLPALVSEELQKITLGDNNKKSICIRRLIVSGQLQSLRNQSRPPNQLFTAITVGEVVSGCSLRESNAVALMSPTVVITTMGVIVACILVFCVCLIIKCASRRRKGNNGSAWKRSEDIVAATISTNKLHSFGGASNLAMTTSIDSDIYDATYHSTPTLPIRVDADRGYSNPSNRGYSNPSDRGYSNPKGNHAPRTVADVQLDMLRSRSYQV